MNRQAFSRCSIFLAHQRGHVWLDVPLAPLAHSSRHYPTPTLCVYFSFCAICGQVKLLLGGAVGGLHTMVDEHFGISIVQYMAAGA